MVTKEYVDRRLAEERKAVTAEMREAEQRLIREFGIIAEAMNRDFKGAFAETVYHDLKGAFLDKLAQYEDRISRLEEHTQLR